MRRTTPVRGRRTLLTAAVLAVLLPAPSFAAIGDGLVVYFPFEGDASDASGNGIHGTEHGNVTYTAGVDGLALTLDGLASSISGSDLSFPFGTDPRSLSVWVKTASLSQQGILFYGTWSYGMAYYVTILTGTHCQPNALSYTYAVGTYGGGTNVCTYGEATDGAWHHVVTTFDGSLHRFYVDGELAASGIRATNTVPSGIFHIGFQSASPWYLNGKLDELRLYDRVLTEEEIQQLSSFSAYSCIGFEPPLASGPVTVRGNRALPFKAQLFDGDSNIITDLDLSAPPVIQVWYEYGTPDADDVTAEALPAGQSSEGNQFFFDGDQRWHYNLKTSNYSAAGTYTVLMDSGDASEYLIEPTCSGEFVVK